MSCRCQGWHITYGTEDIYTCQLYKLVDKVKEMAGMTENKWKSIWEKRVADTDLLARGDVREIFLELKRCDGFDVLGGGMAYEALVEQYQHIKGNLSSDGMGSKVPLESIYEVGGGAGANLFLFERDGMRCGGLDYSESLVKIARLVLKTEDISCCEAVDLETEPVYDAVMANGVFHYFPDEGYALQVLEKMFSKAKKSIGIIDIHDSEKEKDFLEYRKKTIPDYEERYKDLPKLFYRRDFFEEFAARHDMEIRFDESNMKGYWNNGFVFDCYMYKRV